MEEPVVQIKAGFIYQGKTLVLHDVNIHIHPGEFVYLIGKTGSGKSTLLKTLYGDLLLAKGTGQVADFDLTLLTWKKVPYLRRNLGIVFQDFQLLTDRTVEDNLLFTLQATGWKDQRKMKLKVDEVLSKVGLPSKGFKMPHALSGGEQQRVVIARALLNEPEIILGDEPTGNLDPDTSDDILKLLRKVSKDTGSAVLMATHDYHIMEKFPARIIRCANGTVVDEENITVQ